MDHTILYTVLIYNTLCADLAVTFARNDIIGDFIDARHHGSYNYIRWCTRHLMFELLYEQGPRIFSQNISVCSFRISMPATILTPWHCLHRAHMLSSIDPAIFFHFFPFFFSLSSLYLFFPFLSHSFSIFTYACPHRFFMPKLIRKVPLSSNKQNLIYSNKAQHRVYRYINASYFWATMRCGVNLAV